MYHSYWGLCESPFRSGLDARFFYQSPTHDEALARMQFLVDDQRRLGLLLGESGCGKSQLFEIFARHLRYYGCQVAAMSLLGVTPVEMVWQLATQLGGRPEINSPLPVVWRNLADRIAQHRFQQLHTVLLLDDADEAAADTLGQLARLTQIDSAADTRLTVILSGQSHRVAKLGTRLLEMAELRVDVQNWEEADTAGYLEFALGAAGRNLPAFTPEAIAELHRISSGVPRRLKQLADLAMAAGAGYQLELVDVDTIESVFQELAVA